MTAKQDDWIRLAVKFRGKCSVCSREIAMGEVAFWSRSAKSIKHTLCPDQTASQAADGSRSPNNLSKSYEIDCFICGRAAQSVSGFETNDEMTDLHTSICDACFSQTNSYLKYQEAFLKKMQRIANVKI